MSPFPDGDRLAGSAWDDPQAADLDRNLLVVDDLRVAFETSRGRLTAVDGVSFRVRRGETLGIVGESGSGKSVLMRSVMHLLPKSAVTSGTVTFDGADLGAMSERSLRRMRGTDLAMVFQDPMTSLNPVRKVGVLLTESMRYHFGLGAGEARARALELLRQVGIPAPDRRMGEYPHQLSGGMRQRVVIAMALACDPRLLVADEPTTALDVTVQKQILDLLSGLKATREMAMVLITHDLGVVAGRADRVAVMYAGGFAEIAPTSVLFGEMRHPYTAALLESIPRIEEPSQSALAAIAGRPPDMTAVPRGCPFAPRCRYASDRCLVERPALTPGETEGHWYACHHPVGTPAGDASLASNLAAGVSPAGLNMTMEDI